MLRARTKLDSHEEVFVQRYEWLRGWSLRLTQDDQGQAEDLVHDAFIQFTLVRPDLGGIQNLEGYLYAMLRNMHLSNVRRATRAPSCSLSIAEFDSAEIGLRASGLSEQIQVREQLRVICYYACTRKDVSKAGSVLILRFFHGYYPAEIAQILRSPRRAVDDWLLVARREAKGFLNNPFRLASLKGKLTHHGSDLASRQPGDFLGELRDIIFRSRRGICPATTELRELYRLSPPEPLECALLSHIVSCRDCLERINEILGLPSFADRYPTDMLGPDSRPKEEPPKDKPPAKAQSHFAKSSARRVRDVFDHRPKELSLAVNGFILGSQALGAEFNRQTLIINVPEKIGFVEAFSDQGIRLLFLNVDSPPDGAVGQSAEIELSEGRRLTLNLSFAGTWPALDTIYYDPEFKAAAWREELEADVETVVPALETKGAINSQNESLTPLTERIAKWIEWIGRWMRPATITVVFAIILIVALLLVPLRGPSVSAAELIARASASEEAMGNKSNDLVIQRVLNVERRDVKNGGLVGSNRIEIWVDQGRGLQARRVYDAKDQIVAAEWTNYDGTRWVYQPEARLKLQQAPERDARALLGTGELWQLNLSARDFASIIGHVAMAVVDQRGDAYVIAYNGETSTGSDGLVKAMIVLNKTDLHASEETVVVRRGGEATEYRFSEKGFTRVPPDRVAPSVFQIDPGLLNGTAESKDPGSGRERPEGLSGSASESTGFGDQAIANLKLDALYELHRIGACMQEQASLSRTAGGGLRIQAIVETEKRKREVLQALRRVAASPGVEVEVDTEAEALKRHVSGDRSPAIARRVEISQDRIPVYAELRRYFTKQDEEAAASRGTPSSSSMVDEEVRRFAISALNRSRRGLVHAWALKHHAQDVEPVELSRLVPERRAKFDSMIRDHAAAFQQEMGRLRKELQPVFWPSVEEGSGQGAEAWDSARTVERIFQLASSIEEGVRRAFAISAGEAGVLQIKTRDFWRSVKTAERLAASVQEH